MDFPSNVIQICRECAARHTEPPEAIDAAERRIRKLPEFDSLVATLVRSAIADLIYDARHDANRKLKNASGDYGGAAKVVTGCCSATQRIAQSVFEYRIAGTALGLVLGKDLRTIAESESNIAEGHKFNAALCRTLARMVAPEKRVNEAVSEKKLRMIFDRLREKHGNAA